MKKMMDDFKKKESTCIKLFHFFDAIFPPRYYYSKHDVRIELDHKRFEFVEGGCILQKCEGFQRISESSFAPSIYSSL